MIVIFEQPRAQMDIRTSDSSIRFRIHLIHLAQIRNSITFH